MHTDFEVRSIGFNRKHRTGFTVNRPSGKNDYLFIHFLSSAVIALEEKKFTIESGACILYSPGFCQWYSSTESTFANSYIHFDGADMMFFIEQYNIPVNRVFNPMENIFIEDIIKEMESEFLLKDHYWKESIDGMMRHFLARLGRSLAIKAVHRENAAITELCQQFKKVRFQILSSLEKPWTLSEMAKLMNLCTSRFCICYRQFFNISPRSDLIHARVERAKNLLDNRTYTVEEIAELTGYNSTFHFIRQFKAAVGISPGKYRNRSGMEAGD